eukprot:4473923-Amphidinium_carterae.1
MLAKYSDLIPQSHKDDKTIWRYGQLRKGGKKDTPLEAKQLAKDPNRSVAGARVQFLVSAPLVLHLLDNVPNRIRQPMLQGSLQSHPRENCGGGVGSTSSEPLT